MGRTNATFRDLIRRTERDWQPFRRALRRRDQAHFDRLVEHARDHADAAGTLNPTDPVPAILLSIALAQERERAQLADRVDELEATVDELEATLNALAVRTLEGDQRELPPADERSDDAATADPGAAGP